VTLYVLPAGVEQHLSASPAATGKLYSMHTAFLPHRIIPPKQFGFSILTCGIRSHCPPTSPISTRGVTWHRASSGSPQLT